MTKEEILDRLESIASLENVFYSKDYILYAIKKLLNEARMKQSLIRLSYPIMSRWTMRTTCTYVLP